MSKALSKAELAEAAEVLRAMLEMIENGELDAGTPQAVALTRRLQGALVALEAAAND